jgi:G protein beta subunit-like protein
VIRLLFLFVYLDQFLSSKRLLAAAIHKKVNIYEIASGASEPVGSMPAQRIQYKYQDLQLATFEGHTMNVTSVCFHSEGKWLVTGSEDGTIKIWDLRYVQSTAR